MPWTSSNWRLRRHFRLVRETAAATVLAQPLALRCAAKLLTCVVHNILAPYEYTGLACFPTASAVRGMRDTCYGTRCYGMIATVSATDVCVRPRQPPTHPPTDSPCVQAVVTHALPSFDCLWPGLELLTTVCAERCLPSFSACARSSRNLCPRPWTTWTHRCSRG